jgi:hypothetical protein
MSHKLISNPSQIALGLLTIASFRERENLRFFRSHRVKLFGIHGMLCVNETINFVSLQKKHYGNYLLKQ